MTTTYTRAPDGRPDLKRLDTPPTIPDATPIVYAVYGTLMEGQRNSRILEGLGDFGARVEIPGADLFDVGGFPALRIGAGTVKAQLWRPYPEWRDEALRRLDGLEGCRPDGSGMYVRRPLALADGSAATVYIWNHPGYLGPIPSGDWLAHSAAKRAADAERRAEFDADAASRRIRLTGADAGRHSWQGWH
jgi:gamma-glutamylcyclotransferase (GGCT)/AIG2-like uncharacterized protein YtfP